MHKIVCARYKYSFLVFDSLDEIYDLEDWSESRYARYLETCCIFPSLTMMYESELV